MALGESHGGVRTILRERAQDSLAEAA